MGVYRRVNVASGRSREKLAHYSRAVRSRIYVTDIGVADAAARALAKYFREAVPAATLVQVSRLARPEQLVEIELDAIDDAGRGAQRVSSGRAIEREYAYSRAARFWGEVNPDFFTGGVVEQQPVEVLAAAT
jgi:hypothetical protein